MTLQYIPRSLWEDRKWLQRIHLCNRLLMETADWWCRTDADFPISETVAAILYLFSPRADPLSISESELRVFLARVVQPADNEYALAWPNRDQQLCPSLTDAIAGILGAAARAWADGSMLDPPIESVTQHVVDVIVAQRYFVHHHTQTTRRDGGGFHGQG